MFVRFAKRVLVAALLFSGKSNTAAPLVNKADCYGTKDNRFLPSEFIIGTYSLTGVDPACVEFLQKGELLGVEGNLVKDFSETVTTPSGKHITVEESFEYGLRKKINNSSGTETILLGIRRTAKRDKVDLLTNTTIPVNRCPSIYICTDSGWKMGGDPSTGFWERLNGFRHWFFSNTNTSASTPPSYEEDHDPVSHRPIRL